MSRTILVIDDNALVREVLRQMLELRGYSVLLAESGETGLELMNKHKVDAALVDVDMPRMNGLEACRAISQRATGFGRRVFVWLMTGVMRPEIDSGAAAAGALGIISKPFTTAELIARVDHMFGDESQPGAA